MEQRFTLLLGILFFVFFLKFHEEKRLNLFIHLQTLDDHFRKAETCQQMAEYLTSKGPGRCIAVGGGDLRCAEFPCHIMRDIHDFTQCGI